MISHEYSHQVNRARTPNCMDMYASPPHSTNAVLRFAILLRSSLTWENEITEDNANIQKYDFTAHYSTLYFAMFWNGKWQIIHKNFLRIKK